MTESKSIIRTVAHRYGVEPDKMLATLKATAFRDANITNEQMMALLIVADQYRLNPFTREIFAFPDRGGIVPVVGVDGWTRIINENPDMDGCEFAYSEDRVDHKGHSCHEWVECSIYRKGRSRPVTVREYFDEVVRDLKRSSPWDTHPRRMHRHKAYIQAARLAFGFAGIYDQDEAERIIEGQVIETTPNIGYEDLAKTRYDALIESSDALEMYVMQTTLPEAERIALYHSFASAKGKYQKIVDELYRDGASKYADIRDSMYEAMQTDDDLAINETVADLSDDAIAMLVKDLGLGFAAMIE